MAKFSAGKISAKLSNFNLTTTLTASLNGVEARVAGTGIALTTKYVEVRLCLAGSIRVTYLEVPERTEKYVDW